MQTASTHATPRDRLVQAIDTLQDGLSNRHFAARIGVHHNTLSAAKAGTRPFSIDLLGALLRHYPELTGAVTDFVKNAAREEGST